MPIRPRFWRLVGQIAAIVGLIAGCATPTTQPPVAPPPTTAAGVPSVAPTRPPATALVPTPTLPPPAATPDTRTMTSPDYGIQVFLWGNPHTTERDLQLVKTLGFRWIKQMFQWNYIEGQGKGKFEWNEPDRIVTAATNHRLKILARIDFSPMWARPPKSDPNLDGPPARLQDFADFMKAFVTRYRGRIQAYQIWNEPNLSRDWGGRPPSASEYTALLKIAYEVIKEIDPDATVISAGLSPTTATGDIARPDVQYLQEMYDAGAGRYFDMLGVHAAGYKAPPDADPDVVARDPVMGNAGDPNLPEKKRVYAFRHAEDLRQIMVKNGDGHKRVAVLEFGWTSDNRPDSPYKWHSVTEAQKASYLAGAYQWAAENWRPWIGLMSAIYVAAPHWTAQDEQWHWSITDEKGNPRPAFEALKNLRKS